MAGAVAFGTPIPVKKPAPSTSSPAASKAAYGPAGAIDPYNVVGSTGLTAQQIAQSNAYKAQTAAAASAAQANANASYSGTPAPSMPASMAAISPSYEQVIQRQDQQLSNAQNRQDTLTVRDNIREDQLHSAARAEGLEDENRMFQRIAPYLDAISKPIDISSVMSGAGGALPGGSAQAASDLAFARAKDKAGLLAAAKMKNLRETAASAGFDSSGRDLRHAEGILDDTGGYLADVATAEATNEANAARSLEDRNFNAIMSSRQSNLSMLPSLLALVRPRAY